MSSKTDLYYVHLFNDFSGSPRVLLDAINSAESINSNSYLITSNHSGFLDEANVKRINCFYARNESKIIQLFYFLFSQFLLFFQLFFILLRSRLSGRKVTVIINTMLPFGAGAAAKFLATNVVYYIHETYLKPDIFKRFLRFFIEHCATHIIYVSNYLKDIETFTNAKIVSTVIYNGLRSDFLKIEKIESKKKFENKQLFFAGSLKKYKGIHELILLANSLPEFEFLAALNCETQELKKFLSDNLIPLNLNLCSRPKNIQLYFERSFAVLNLSLPDEWVETFGLSLLEGMASGSPVIAPPIGGPIEYVNEKNGCLIDSRDTAKLVAFIRYINSDFNVWNEFSQASLVTSKRFTSGNYKQCFLNFLKENNLIDYTQ